LRSLLGVEPNGFNLRREAIPLATAKIDRVVIFVSVFQSQTRSHPPGDCLVYNIGTAGGAVSISDEKPSPWRRAWRCHCRYWTGVSISDEKPSPWRRHKHTRGKERGRCFNLRREAIPLATIKTDTEELLQQKFQSQTRSHPPGDLLMLLLRGMNNGSFNLRREAIPLATRVNQSRQAR